MVDIVNTSDGSVGSFFIRKFGRNDDIDSGSAPEDIWDFGGLYPFPAAAAATTIVSDSVNDALVGTGMRRARVFGLDANFLMIEEDVELNGTTPVPLVNQYSRVQRVFGLEAGSSGFNEGNIDVAHGGTVLARISVNRGQTLMAVFTTPANWPIVTVISAFVTIGRQASGFGEVILFTRESGTNCWRDRLTVDVHSQGSSFVAGEGNQAVNIPPLTDIRWTAQSVSANNTGVSASFVLSNRV